MAQELFDRDEVNTAEDQIRGEGVPEIVKSTRSDAGVTKGCSKRTRDALDNIAFPFEHSSRPWTLNPLKCVHREIFYTLQEAAGSWYLWNSGERSTIRFVRTALWGIDRRHRRR